MSAAPLDVAPVFWGASRRDRAVRGGIAALFWGFVVANAVALVWIWLANHNLPFKRTGDGVARIGALTGLLGAYLAYVQVLLLARIPWLERVAGFDRITILHHWNGFLVLALVVAHTFLSVLGYSMVVHRSFFDEFWTMVGKKAFPGMVTATIATALIVLVAVGSVVIVKRRLRYEYWYAIHLSAYLGIALSWFHELPVGGDITPVFHPRVADYWHWLFRGAILLLAFRLVSPILKAIRYRFRVTEVKAESDGVTSIRISGHGLDGLKAKPGQFFIWRFLAPGHWWSAHPFSLSAAPTDGSFRISAKAVGDHTRALRDLPVGTRVVAEGPFGAFTEAVRRHPKVLLIGGGIGITPVRALAETMKGDVVLIHRVLSDADAVFADELAGLARDGLTVHRVVGDHAAPGGDDLLSARHLLELVPDLKERDVYLSGPPGMVSAIGAELRSAGVARRDLHVERFAL